MRVCIVNVGHIKLLLIEDLQVLGLRWGWIRGGQWTCTVQCTYIQYEAEGEVR